MWSRNRLRSRKLLAAALAASSVAGCADYLNHPDTVTLRAGDAQNWNKAVQTTDPWPPYVKNTDIDGDGQRTANVIRRYPAAAGAAAAGGAAQEQ